jgi:hypothetical protein
VSSSDSIPLVAASFTCPAGARTVMTSNEQRQLFLEWWDEGEWRRTIELELHDDGRFEYADYSTSYAGSSGQGASGQWRESEGHIELSVTRSTDAAFCVGQVLLCALTASGIALPTKRVLARVSRPSAP